MRSNKNPFCVFFESVSIVIRKQTLAAGWFVYHLKAVVSVEWSVLKPNHCHSEINKHATFIIHLISLEELELIEKERELEFKKGIEIGKRKLIPTLVQKPQINGC